MYEWTEKPEELKNYLIRRLDALWAETLRPTCHNPNRIIGNCNEIELMLMYMFGMRVSQFDLIHEKVRRSKEYYRLKYGGYCLTSEVDGNHYTIKDGKRVEPKFWLVDNGIGDMRAVEAARDFQNWLKESGVTKLEWMLEADIIPPSLLEVEAYTFDEFFGEESEEETNR